MIGCKAIATACLVSAFSCCGIGAASASAELTGTTGFTCKNLPGLGNFSDAHCAAAATPGNYAHVQIESGESTELSGTNSSTCEGTKTACPFRLKSTIAGLPETFEAKNLSLAGFISNSLVGEERRMTGTGTLTLDEASVSEPAGKSCVIKGGKIVSKLLKLTTAGVGMSFKAEASEGTLLAEFTVEGCTIAALNGKYELKGTVIGIPSGSTVGFTEAETTSQGTLTLRGQKAGLEAQATLSARAKSSEGFTPLSLTTASNESFAATEYPATLSGNQAVQHAFAAGTKEIECTESAFPGSLPALSSTLSITPEYKGCRTELNLPTTATMNGCSYVLHRVGKTTISCPAGKKIQFHVFESEKKHLANEALCTYSIPPQGPIGEVVYEPEGSGSTADLLIKYKVTGITYEVEGPKLQCGSSASNGEYTGSSTETAKNEKGEPNGLFLK